MQVLPSLVHQAMQRRKASGKLPELQRRDYGSQRQACEGEQKGKGKMSYCETVFAIGVIGLSVAILIVPLCIDLTLQVRALRKLKRKKHVK